MSNGFYDFDSNAEHWTEMFEQAQNLGFNPLLPADNFTPRIFGLRSLKLDKEKDNGSLTGDWYFAPKNNPVELVMDYFMKLMSENTREVVRAFAYFTAQVFEDGVGDGVIDLSECKKPEDYAKVFCDVLAQGALMTTKGKTWKRFLEGVQVNMPEVVVLGHPDAVANMVATTNEKDFKEMKNADVDDFLKNVFKQEEE
tara:strand:- start:3 stop:596 length:594 start_codon:yes stop_codon:yes gene_type:complete